MLVSHLRSIIAADELNFCVRNGNRCFLTAMGTEVRLFLLTLCAQYLEWVNAYERPRFDVQTDTSAVEMYEL